MKRTILISFFLLIVSVMLLSVIMTDETISVCERRQLKEFPEFTWEELLAGDYALKVESYLLDHMPFRENFRSFKAWSESNVFAKTDINDIYMEDGHLFKMQYPYKPEMSEKFVEYIESVTDKYFENNNVYVGVVPDKNYYSFNGYLKLNYKHMIDTVKRGEYQYIELFDTLSLNSYYKTDLHWKQETLWPVVRRLSDTLGFDMKVGPADYTINTYEAFYGAYAGQSTRNTEADVLTFLSLSYFDELKVMNYEKASEISIYNKEHLSNLDAYDVFLSGACALLEIENPNASSDMELVIFRDSFGSSITPLLIDSYSKIIMIDTRYFPYEYLGQFIEFNAGQDVLFLYSTLVINNSIMLR